MPYANSLATAALVACALCARAQATPEPTDAHDESATVDCRLAERPRLSHNPTRETLGVRGLRSDVEQAFLSDLNGRTVAELGEAGRSPEWRLPDYGLGAGRYYLVLHSAGEWHSFAVELE